LFCRGRVVEINQLKIKFRMNISLIHLTLYLERIIDLEEVALNKCTRNFCVAFTQFPTMETSCTTVAQNQK
jgi:hypothetical protein